LEGCWIKKARPLSVTTCFSLTIHIFFTGECLVVYLKMFSGALVWFLQVVRVLPLTSIWRTKASRNQRFIGKSGMDIGREQTGALVWFLQVVRVWKTRKQAEFVIDSLTDDRQQTKWLPKDFYELSLHVVQNPITSDIRSLQRIQSADYSFELTLEILG